MKIIPAILAKTEEEFINMVKRIEPYTDLVHLDIADGEFVPNKTIEGIEELKKINTKLNFEVHLMTKEPEKFIEKWFETPASRFLIHWESMDKFGELVRLLHGNKKEFGGVLNPETDYKLFEPYVEELDVVQFMTVNPGFYGSLFLPEVLENIRNFHIRYPGKKIQVDGWINPETLKFIISAGVSSAAVGSYIFKSENIERALEELNV